MLIIGLAVQVTAFYVYCYTGRISLYSDVCYSFVALL